MSSEVDVNQQKGEEEQEETVKKPANMENVMKIPERVPKVSVSGGLTDHNIKISTPSGEVFNENQLRVGKVRRRKRSRSYNSLIPLKRTKTEPIVLKSNIMHVMKDNDNVKEDDKQEKEKSDERKRLLKVRRRKRSKSVKKRVEQFEEKFGSPKAPNDRILIRSSTLSLHQLAKLRRMKSKGSSSHGNLGREERLLRSPRGEYVDRLTKSFEEKEMTLKSPKSDLIRPMLKRTTSEGISELKEKFERSADEQQVKVDPTSRRPKLVRRKRNWRDVVEEQKSNETEKKKTEKIDKGDNFTISELDVLNFVDNIIKEDEKEKVINEKHDKSDKKEEQKDKNTQKQEEEDEDIMNFLSLQESTESLSPNEEESNEKIEEQVRKLKKELADERVISSDLKSKYLQVKSDVESLKNQTVQEERNKTETLSSEIEKLTRSLISIQNKLQEKEKTIRTEKKKNQDYHEKYEKMSSENSNHLQNIKELETKLKNEREKYGNEMGILIRQLQSKDETIRSKDLETNEYRDEINILKSEMNTLKKYNKKSIKKNKSVSIERKNDNPVHNSIANEELEMESRMKEFNKEFTQILVGETTSGKGSKGFFSWITDSFGCKFQP